MSVTNSGKIEGGGCPKPTAAAVMADYDALPSVARAAIAAAKLDCPASGFRRKIAQGAMRPEDVAVHIERVERQVLRP